METATLAYAGHPKIPLSALADFIPGYRIRRRQISRTGSISIIRKRDIVHGRLSHDLEQAHLPSLSASQLLRDGDVILHSHYGCFTPVVFDVVGVCMTCAAPLIIIRIRQQTELLPEYLAWLLQSSEGQQALAAYASQGSTEEVAIEGLHGITFHVPPTGIQRLIGGIKRLYSDERNQALLDGGEFDPMEELLFDAVLLRLAGFSAGSLVHADHHIHDLLPLRGRHSVEAQEQVSFHVADGVEVSHR